MNILMESNILKRIYTLYESKETTLSFDKESFSFIKIKDKKDFINNKQFYEVKLEDSFHILENCLIKKDQKNNIKNNSIIKIKKIELRYIDKYYFILTDFIFSEMIELKSSINEKKILIAPSENIIEYKKNNFEYIFERNKYYDNLKNKIKYEGLYIITNSLINQNKLITLFKYSTIEYIGNLYDIFGKIINIDEKNLSCLLVNENEDICSLKLNDNLFELIQINHYYSINHIRLVNENEQTLYKEYEFTKETKIKKLDDENYKTTKKKIEEYAVIKFIFIDYNNNSNYFKKISANLKEIDIIYKVQYLCTSNKNIKSSYYLETFNLFHENTVKKNYKLFIYKNEINIINCFINNNNSNSKCYEILYLTKNEKYLPQLLILSDGTKITEYDSFDSHNRRRFNILNSKNKTTFYKQTNIINLQIVYLINDNGNKHKYGVFSVNSWNPIYNKQCNIDKNLFKILNEYYNEQKKEKNYNNYKSIHNIYLQKLDKTQYDTIIKKTENEIKIYMNFLETVDEFDFYKSIFLFYFIEKCSESKIINYFQLVNYINDVKFAFLPSTKIKILNYFVKFVAHYHHIIPVFYHINHSLENDYFKLAFQLQIDIINHLKESSILFYPLLQFNSYALKKIDEKYPEISYTISMERLDTIKNHLLLFQNEFFLKIAQSNKLNFLATTSKKEGITLINNYLLLENRNTIGVNAKAFLLNLELSHERLGHGKEIINKQNSPKIYFNKEFRNS